MLNDILKLFKLEDCCRSELSHKVFLWALAERSTPDRATAVCRPNEGASLAQTCQWSGNYGLASLWPHERTELVAGLPRGFTGRRTLKSATAGLGWSSCSIWLLNWVLSIFIDLYDYNFALNYYSSLSSEVLFCIFRFKSTDVLKKF